MRASVSMAGEAFARLRRRIAEIETAMPAGADAAEPRPPKALRRAEGSAALAELAPGTITAGLAATEANPFAPRRAGTLLPFAVPAVDHLLGGGLRRSALHEIRAAESRDAGAASGFAAALLARLSAKDDRRILWIVESTATAEAGFIYGGGIAALGLDPRRLIVVNVKRASDALWVFEEGLRCRGLAAVLTEIRGHPRLLDLTASRRLALRARAHGVMGLLLRQADHADPGASTTRWRVAPHPAGITDGYAAGIGRSAWRLTLERNRHGATGSFDLEWDHDGRTFALAGPRTVAALPLRIAPPLPERSAASPDAGQGLALAS